jgi:hypothetical protein
MRSLSIFKQIIAFLFLLVFYSLNSVAATDTETIDSGSIKQQFEYVINKSTQYNEYRAVRSIWLDKLKTHSLDTIASIKTGFRNYQKLSGSQAKQIDSLKVSLSETSEKLDVAIKEKNSLRIFGIKVAKGKYNTLVTIIILGLLAVLILGFLVYGRLKAASKRDIKDLADLKEEFEMFRKRALEREQKMARQHLDEIMKYKNMPGSPKKEG